MKVVQIYTDGCALGNPGKGGAGAVLVYGDVQKELKLHIPDTTNNRAELEAVILGLEALKRGCTVEIFSDSQVTVKCASGEYKRQSNHDLWQRFEFAESRHRVTYNWIRKDSHPLNHRAHELANEAARQPEAA